MKATVLQLKNVLSQFVTSQRPDTVFLVTSNPETIGDTQFKFDNDSENLKYYNELIKDPRKTELIQKDDGIILYEFPAKFALLDTVNKEVLYYMQYIEKRVLKTPSVTQIKVWSSEYSKHTEKFTKSGDSVTIFN